MALILITTRSRYAAGSMLMGGFIFGMIVGNLQDVIARGVRHPFCMSVRRCCVVPCDWDMSLG
jgi:hypothetical protein